MIERKEFTTDGCSGGMSWLWRKVFHKAPPWEHACITHDKAYWAGGSRAMREAADIRLMLDVMENGHPYWAVFMYAGVRFGGAPIWPTSYRWCYGMPYRHAWRYGSVGNHVPEQEILGV